MHDHKIFECRTLRKKYVYRIFGADGLGVVTAVSKKVHHLYVGIFKNNERKKKRD